jgi:gliding motility-associated-like protein
MKLSLKYFLILALTILIYAVGNEARAANVTATWTGAISTDWNTAGNWNGGLVPFNGNGGDNYSVIIPTGLTNYPDLGTNSFTIRSITSMGNGASISGTGTLTLTFAATTTVTGTAIISCPLSISVATTFSETNATDQLTISGVISGTVALTKAGSGILILAGDNSYSGLTTISAGTLKLGASGDGTNGPLGTTAASTIVSNGAAFDLNGFTLGTAEAISLRGTGVSLGGALTNTGGNASYSGAITLAAATTINANTSGTLTLSGNCSGNFALTLDGDGTGFYSGVRSGTSTIVKTGASTWTLSGENSYSGLTTISAGILKLGANGGAVNTPLGTTAAATTIASGATLDLNGFTLGTAEAITSLAGTGVSGAGALTNTGIDASFSGNITLITPGATISATNSGTLSLSGNISGNFPLTLDGNGIGNYSGVRSGTSTVVKQGTGTWTLSGLNTYTGTSTVTGGVLRAENNTVVASTNGPFGNNASGLILNGGTIQSNVATFSRPLTVTATNSGLDAYGSARTISSAITLATAGTFNLNIGGTYAASAEGQELTLSGIISNSTGTLGLTKIGTSTAILSGTNTYTGSTTVSTGILRANTTNIIASTNGPFGNNASGLNLNGGTIQSNVTTFSRPITVTAANSGIDAYGLSRTISSVIDNASGSTFNLNIGGTTAASAEGQDLTLSGIISNSSGALGLTKIGTSKVIITGTNTFSGGVSLNAGTLNIDNNQALGTVAGTFTIAGGTIDASTSGISTLNYPLALNADFTFTGTNSLNLGAGNVSMNADRQITVSANTLTLGGTISQATRTLTKAGAGTLSFGSNTVTLNGLSISAGSLTSTSGILNLAGNFSNSGTFTHNGGTVNLNGTGLQTITGSTTFSTLKINNSTEAALANAISVSTLTIGDVTSNSIFNDGGFQLTSTGTLNLTSGTFKLGSSGTATTFPAFATRNISAGTTVEYASGAAQTVSVIPGYQNLTYSGAGVKTVAAGGTLSVAGNFSTTGGTATFTTTANATVTGNITGTGAITMGSGTLTVSGNWTNNGTFTAGTGTVNFNGSSQTIAPVTYNNLTINQSGGNATLAADATVNGILSLSSGNLAVTDPYVLTMGGSATTTGAKDVTGIVKRTSLVAATSYTFGNEYTTISFRNEGTLPTEISVKISIGSAPSWKTGAVQRTYDIIRTGGSGTAVALSLHYLDTELNGNTESNLVLWDAHLPSPPGDVEEHGRSNYDLTNNWVRLSALDVSYLPTAFGSMAWTLANTAISSSTWTGSVNTDWSDPGNWTPPGVPSDLTDVIIPDASTTPNDPTLGLSIAVGRLTIESGGILNAIATSTLTISGASGAWSNIGGTFNPSTGTVIFTNASANISGATNFYNVTINSGGALRMTIGSTMRIGGVITNNGIWGASGLNTSVEYNGGDQTVLNPNGATPGYNNLILSGTGTKTMPGTTLSLRNSFSMSGSASATAAAAINTTGNFTIGSGTSFTAGTFTHTIGGNFSNTGTFTSTGSTFNFNGAAQTINNANTWYNLSITGTAARIVTFQSGVAQTVSNSLTLTGASGQLLSLVPSASPTKWQINAPATQSVSYVSASYSDASAGTTISADDGTNINGGNNINWNFSAQTTPTFSPAAGAIAFGTTVTISSAGADAIYYTIDGSDPTTSSTNQATTPLVINSSLTAKALAVKAGSPNSAIGSAAYTQAASADLTGLVLSGSPSNYTFASGTYTYNGVKVLNAVSNITITPTGAGTITVDGATVSSGSASAAINLTAGVQKAIVIVATETGKSAKTYTINVTRNDITSTPIFSPVAGAIAFGTTVSISSTGADAIYYTTDGSDPTIASTLYSAPVTINSALTLKALAVKAGYDNSAIGSAAYTQAASADLTGLVLSGSPSNYTFASGTYNYNGTTVLNTVSSITITPTGAGTITVDGTTVSSGSASAAIALTAGVQKAIVIMATETGKSAKTYTINITRNGAAQATPTFDPVAGAITFGFTVAITSAGADAIYYTTDGSDPTIASTLYAAPVAINSALTLKALAVKAGLDNSAIGSAAYTQAASADLTGLVLSGSPSAYTFASGTYTYNGVTVTNTVNNITITPTGPGTITVNGTIVSSETASAAIDLTAGVQKTILIVVSESGKSDKTYTINVTRALNPAKAITAFTIMGNGTVNESAKTIAVTVPCGTSVTALVASFTTTGASVKIGGVSQTSGTTANNFSSPVTYTVTAADATTQDYVVTVSVAPDPSKEITAFTILGNGTVNETAKTIAVTLPYGTNVSALVASFSTTGVSVKVGSTEQTSGTTANNFSSPVTYTVTAQDATTQDYVVTVSVAANPAKAITAFTIMGNGTVNESAKTIAVTLPYGTNVSALVASFSTTGESVKVGGIAQTSETTANNFSSPVTYTVIAADATTQDYVVTVTVAANPAKAITAFLILGNGTVNENAKTIAVTVPYGTNLTALTASFTTTGTSVKVGGITQTSGTTANNFSSPVTYTVTAADASTQDYVVTVSVAGNTSKAITAFTILGNGTVNESTKSITVTLPYGTDLTALAASFTTTGAFVKVGGVTQISGTTVNNFSTPLTYTVTAADGSTLNYMVTVTIAANPAKAITTFTILGNGTVNESEKTITVTVPYGTNLTALTASFTTTGTSVKVGGITQTSGTTVNNFNSPVTYTVTAADASTQDYVVTVSVAGNTSKAITAFTIMGNGTVNESTKTIAVTLPYGTNLNALTASFTTTGTSVTVGGITQTSGTTVNNFSTPLTYTVSAPDGSTQNYVVTVTVASITSKAITAFTILGTGKVNESTKTIDVTLPYGTDLTALAAIFTSTGASVKVGGVIQISGTSINNFSNPVIYTVLAADGTTQNYSIRVNTAADPAKAITVFTILGNGTVNESNKTIAVNLPYGSDLTALAASFTITGASVKVGGLTQISGTTVNNFNSPVTYTVTAADGTTQDYVVTVSLTASNAKAITAFTILGTGTINENAKTINVTLPFGTDPKALVATFTTTGVSVKVGEVTQISGKTANNFSNLLIYTITAADASTQAYVVSVNMAKNPAKSITAFTILGNGIVNESAKTIAVTLPYGTNLTALVASFTTTGASVRVGGVTQTSGTTANNFSSPVTYTVTAADASTLNYLVTVSIETIPLTAGSIGSDQLICEGITAPLIQTEAATGGSGIYTYQWQKSTISSSTGFYDIEGATDIDYAPGNLSQTTWYKRLVSSQGYNSAPSESNTVTITVTPPVSHNLINAPSKLTFCHIAEPGLITGSTPDGGSGNYTFQWKFETAESTCLPISGATSKDYNPGVLTKTTEFRREVISGNCVYLSNTIRIIVTQPLVNNIIFGNQTITSDNKPEKLIGTVPEGGETKKSYLWESSTLSDTSGFVPAAGINSEQNYSPPMLTQSTFFRRGVSSGICPMVYSNSVKITLNIINRSPVASDDSYTTVKNTPLFISGSGGLLKNDTDPDNNTLTATVVSSPANGTLILNSDGGFTYTPSGNFTGRDSFTYSSCDNEFPNFCDTGTVTIIVTGSQLLGIAKTVSTPMRQLDGFNSNILTYKITVRNYGNLPLKNLQVTDDLTISFPFPTKFTIQGIPSTSKGILVPSSAYDGRVNNNLLKSGNTLQAGETDTIQFTIKVTPYDNIMGPYYNSAKASASDPDGKPAEDISTTGSNPDPDNNGIPDESLATIVMLEKVTVRIPEGFSPNGDSVNDMFIIENLDNEQISLQVFNSLGALVYKNTNYKNDWAGLSNQRNYSGKEIPNGTYYYIVSKRNNNENYASFITITR